MVVLRILLYIICISSIFWSVLVFAGPPVIKRLILAYSDGALIPSGITVSPGLNVSISRLGFNFENEIEGQRIEGFSRASEIAWSLSREKPFLEISLGPSVVKDYATADRVNFSMPSFKSIDWQNIVVAANIDTLALNSFAEAESVALEANLNLESAKLSDVSIEAEKFSLTYGGSIYYANLINSRLRELNFDTPMKKQLFSSIFTVEDITASGLNFAAPQAVFEIILKEDRRKLKIDLNDAKLFETDGFIKNIKVDGTWSQLNVLEELNIDLVSGMFFEKSPKFQVISMNVKKSDDAHFQANITGNLEEFEMSDSDKFIGIMPSGNFVIDLEMDRTTPKLNSVSKISFDSLNAADIFGTVEMEFSSELLTDFGCEILECKFSNFNLEYLVNFDDDWVRGNAKCPQNFCGFSGMDYLVRTSNTVNIFTILNQEKILNPLYSLYLLGTISSGRKIDEGHELKFHF